MVDTKKIRKDHILLLKYLCNFGIFFCKKDENANYMRVACLINGLITFPLWMVSK